MTTERVRTSKGFRRSLIILKDNFNAFKDEYRTNLAQAVQDEMSKLAELDGLNNEDLVRIKPTVYEAAQCYHAANWWQIFKKTRRDFRGTYLMMLVATLIALLLILYFALRGFPDFRGLNTSDFNVIFVTLFILLVIRAIMHSRVAYNYLLALVIFEAFLAVVAIRTFRHWSSRIIPAWKAIISSSPAGYHVRLSAVPIVQIVYLTLWVFAAFLLVWALVRGTHHLVYRFSSDVINGYDVATEKSASLLLGFLNISHSLKVLLEGFGPKSGWTANPTIYSLRGSAGRAEVDQAMLRLARLANGPWRLAMLHSHRGGAGQWAAHQAPRIEFFLQQQRLQNMLVSSNLIAMNEAMTTAMIRAADGKWNEIGEYDAHEAAYGNWRRVLRRLTAIVIAIVAALTVKYLTKNASGPYVQIVVLTLLSYAAIQFLTLIDPQSSAPLDVATKITALIRRTPNSGG